MGIRLKMVPMSILLPVTQTIIKIRGHSRLNSLEARVIQLTDISTKNAAFKETNSQASVTVQDVLLNDNLDKLTTAAQQLAPERRNNNRNLVTVASIKMKNYPNTNLALPEILNFPILTTVHALNHWSADKI